MKKQVVASWSALAVSFIVLIASVICPLLELRRLNKSISPLVELAFDAAYRGDGESVAEAASGIRSIVLEAEKKLSLVAGHRDIAELKRFAGELTALGADGERDAYIADLNGIRSSLDMLIESNLLTLRNIL